MKFIEKIKTHKYIVISILILIAVIYGGQKLLNSEDSATIQQTNSTYTVKLSNITSAITASGTVETANYLPINTSVNGIVKEVFVKEGDEVVSGQKIMEITLNSDGQENLSSAYSSYLSAKNSLEKAKSDLLSKESTMINAEEAFKTEKENNSYQTHDERISYKLAENAYTTAKDSYDQQKSSITQSEIALNKAWLSYQSQSPVIVAPDSGKIANILVVEGMDISNSLSERTSTSVAAIKKEGNPIVSLDISELDINKISVGQKVLTNLSSLPDETFEGEVVGIDKVGTISSGVTNYTIIVRFKENSDLVLPNMGVDAQIILQEKNKVVAVPSSALTSEKQKIYVTKLDNSIEEKVEVQTGITDGSMTEITEGLNEGDVVVINSLPTSGFTEAQQNSSQGNFRGNGLFLR